MSSSFEVKEPIQNSPYLVPGKHWYIQEGHEATLLEGRRPAMVFPPSNQKQRWTSVPGLLEPSAEYPAAFDLKLVNLIRERLDTWRNLAMRGEGGVSRVTMELLQYWHREGRNHRLFFAQLEAAETVIFLTEGRPDLLQGINIPRDEPSEDRKSGGYEGFKRYALKMATGSGKSTVMAMLSAWSILNKLQNPRDKRFSDVALVVCPSVTIRDRLRELDPQEGLASVYRTRDLVPEDLMPMLQQGRVIVTNWHVLEPHGQTVGGETGKVVKTGVPVRTVEKIKIGPKTTTARGTRYLTLSDFRMQVGAGLLKVLEEIKEKDGSLKEVKVESVRYVESDTALVNRVLKKVGGKQNILVFNDEAHHAYRIHKEDVEAEDGEEFGDDEEREEFFREATVWVDGLDRIDRIRGINTVIDLSATPYYLGRIGQEANKPFQWVVSDFGLIDAIESGLVKIPQLAVRDTTGRDIPGYFNIWHWVMEKLTPAEKGGKRGSPKPEAILKWAHAPIAMLGGLWEKDSQEGLGDDPRPPVFILVCKNTQIAKVIFEWLAEDKCPTGIPSSGIKLFRNLDQRLTTIRVDSKVVNETDTGSSKDDEKRWMRFTLDTVGRLRWPTDHSGNPLCPEGFVELAKKLDRPLDPPGRDIRCIVSVGMLTEGWDCNTVTHIIGLRPFMSQLLCEQVVGRGLRRHDYQPMENGLMKEEVAKVFGVPFEVVPFKASGGGGVEREKRHHIYAVPARSHLEIRFPRVEGYIRNIKSKITLDWDHVATISIDPMNIPPEVEMKGLNVNNQGRMSLTGPGRLDRVAMDAFRKQNRIQRVEFAVAQAVTKAFLDRKECEVPAHTLFPQVLRIVQKYVANCVVAKGVGDKKDLAHSPYFGWLVETLLEAIRPDTDQGEDAELPRFERSRGDGSSGDADDWTSKNVVEVVKSHVNYVVADTQVWEQNAAYYLDTSPHVEAFVKNFGRIGFAVPYLFNGVGHDFQVDFLIRMAGGENRYLLLETKGGREDPDKVAAKQSAATRWCNAVTNDGRYGSWAFALCTDPREVPAILAREAERAGPMAVAT